jgi:RHS repeat-associated protein
LTTILYYLNARYYNHQWRRFISPDGTSYLDPENVNGLNLYAYCNNDPVNYADPSGHSPKWLQDLAIGLSIVGAILVTGAITALTMGVGTTIMVTSMAGAVIHGAAVGTLIGAGVGVVGGAIVGGAFTDWSVKGVLTGAGIGFGGGAILGAIIGGSIGAAQYTNAARSWLHGKDSMISHFNNHGVDMGYKNVIQYTKSAKKVIKNGTYIYYSKNAEEILSKAFIISGSLPSHSASNCS